MLTKISVHSTVPFPFIDRGLRNTFAQSSLSETSALPPSLSVLLYIIQYTLQSRNSPLFNRDVRFIRLRMFSDKINFAPREVSYKARRPFCSLSLIHISLTHTPSPAFYKRKKNRSDVYSPCFLCLRVYFGKKNPH